jgi:DNA-directed RNA polymerase omega subunit
MDEKFPDRIDSKFRYVLLSSARAEQLMRGARSKVEAVAGKQTTVAMREITEDRVEWGYGPSPTLEEEMALPVAAEVAAPAEEAEEEVH